MSIKVKLERMNDSVHFKASNESGVFINLDGAEKIGGQSHGVRPMESLLMGLGGCSAIDVILILKKMRQELDDIKLYIDATTIDHEYHREFGSINILFKVWGVIKEEKLKKAIELSIEKYCSVSKILGRSAEIKYEYQLNPEN